MAQRSICEPHLVRSSNGLWALGVLVIWVGMFFAFLLIAIARP